MNRIALGLFLFLFSFSFASASESYDVDFSEVSTQAIFVYDGDEIRFSLLGGDHVIIIEDVGSSSIKVDIGPFVDRQNILTPGLIGLDYIMKLDLDKDGVTDLNVALYAVSAEGEVHLVLQDVRAADQGAPEDVGLVEGGNSGISKIGVLIIVGTLILVLVLFLVFRNGFWSDTEKKTEEHVHHSSEKTDSSEELKEEAS
ncbi:MAG: hypothetical protein QT08_C0009G0117 [archaeon GW2011_AR17]|nr:MAG: hypothetical protein QT08_C0009G0117 [archaeon GW2011_AR17]HIH59136.1 hypothetical protein [Nanoarchaeota archaeon]HIJ05012.1 hypothetical protein [Nanoarchaeota archaeon]